MGGLRSPGVTGRQAPPPPPGGQFLGWGRFTWGWVPWGQIWSPKHQKQIRHWALPKLRYTVLVPVLLVGGLQRAKQRVGGVVVAASGEVDAPDICNDLPLGRGATRRTLLCLPTTLFQAQGPGARGTGFLDAGRENGASCKGGGSSQLSALDGPPKWQRKSKSIWGVHPAPFFLSKKKPGGAFEG